MKTLARGLALTFLLLCVIAAVAGVALSRWFNPEEYRDTLRQWVLDRSGLQLEWQAPMRWSLFPALGVELQNVTLTPVANPEQPLARARRVAVSVQVWPLLWREIDVRLLDAEGVALTLQRDNNGRGNWESLLSSIHPVTLADSTPPSETPLPTSSAWKLSVAGISLQDSALHYQEEATGRRFSLNQIDLKTQHLFENKAIPFTLRAQAEGGPWPWQWAGEVEGSLRFERAAQRYQVEGMRLKGTLTGEPVPNASLVLDARGDIAVDARAQTWAWNHARLEANQLSVLGELQGQGVGSEATFVGGISVAAFDMRAFMASVGRPLPSVVPATALRQVSIASKLSGNANTLRWDELRIQADEGRLQGQLQWQMPHDNQSAQVSGALKATLLDLDAWLPTVPLLKTTSPEISIPDTTGISSGRVSLGDSPLPAAPEQPAWNAEASIPLSALQRIALDLTLNAERVRWQRWPLEDVQARVQASDGVWRIEHFSARLLGGSVQAQAQLEHREEVPRWQFSTQIEQVPVERLLALGSLSELPPLTGYLQLQAELHSQGSSAQAVINNLSGHAQGRIEKGSLPGVQLEQPLCRAIAAYRQQVPAQMAATPSNKLLRDFSTGFEINQGVARSTELQAQVPGMALNGEGAVDLRTLGLDYRIRVRIANGWPMPDPACQLDARTAAMSWVLHCRGPLKLGARSCRAEW